MRWPEALAATLVALSAVWLMALALMCALAPATAARFLSAFAQTPRAHYLEQALRIAAGLALWQHADQMLHRTFWQALGALLVVTSVGLLLLPWRWHRHFAASVVPLVQRYLGIYALLSLGLGAFVLYALLAAA